MKPVLECLENDKETKSGEILMNNNKEYSYQDTFGGT